MSSSLNKVQLIGHLGKDPEIRSFQNGGKAASLSLATSESWKDKETGERKERTEWHRISITNDGLVGVVEKYLKKGAKIYIEGQLETRKWTDKEGQERYSTEIVLRPYSGELLMLGSFAQRYVKRHGLAPPFRHDPGVHGYDPGGNIGRRQSSRS
jgi:single-strand DNA-binding protein